MTDPDRDWLEGIRSELESVPLQQQVCDELDRRRRHVISAVADRHRPISLPVAALATACLVLAVVITRPANEPEGTELINDLDVMTSSDNLELIEDLEFYEWLENYEFPS